MSATMVSVPTCMTPFKIVSAHREDGARGFKGVWLRRSPRELDSERDATAWRETKDEVRRSMANLYSDIYEAKGGER